MDGFVLAGGRSSRMGTDKARAPFRGRPLALAAVDSLRAVCDRVALVRRKDDGLPWPDVEVVWERDDGDPHPLWGVVSALRAARTERVAVLACDVPGVSPATWAALAAAAPAVAWDGVRVHPLVAVLERSMADAAEALAGAGAPAWRLADGIARVSVDGAELADHDDPASLAPGPIRTLLASVPATDPAVLARIARGERGRLAALGMVDPNDPG
jgi:molybdopterin-guanine dinucleotide biosynthesis protein A